MHAEPFCCRANMSTGRIRTQMRGEFARRHIGCRILRRAGSRPFPPDRPHPSTRVGIVAVKKSTSGMSGRCFGPQSSVRSSLLTKVATGHAMSRPCPRREPWGRALGHGNAPPGRALWRLAWKLICTTPYVAAGGMKEVATVYKREMIRRRGDGGVRAAPCREPQKNEGLLGGR